MSRRALFGILRFASLLVLLLPSAAIAKKVGVEWKEIRGAKLYEIQVEQDGKTVAQKRTDDTSWKGNLEVGIYSYQIRAIDRVGRPGKWSAQRPLIVMPAPPEPRFPEDGAKLVHYGEGVGLRLRWDGIKGVSRYLVEVGGGRSAIRQTVQGTSFELKGLSPGNYSWKVTAIVETAGRKWEGNACDPREFRVSRDSLAPPVPVFPLGVIPPPKKNRLTFEWKKVNGAELYEVELIPDPSGQNNRGPAADQPRKFTTEEASIEVESPGEGGYLWKVRALANVQDAAASARAPESVGPVAASSFKIDRNAKFFEGAGYVALSAMIAPYSYRGISPFYNFSNKDKDGSLAMTGRLSGEYYFHPLWGVGLGFDGTRSTFLDQNFDRFNLEATLRFRMSLGEDKTGWSFSPKAGLEIRDYFLVVPSVYTGKPVTEILTGVKTRAYGPQIGFDLRKQFTDKISLGAKVAYFYPIGLSGENIQGLTGDASRRNLSVGLQGLFWLSQNWGVGLGGFYDRRSISYTLTTSSADKGSEQVYMDGTYFFGSVLYSWR